MSMPDYDGLDYTMKEYMRYVEHTKSCVERLNSQSPGEFFLILFSIKLKFFGSEDHKKQPNSLEK